jgi:hypothetical protein
MNVPAEKAIFFIEDRSAPISADPSILSVPGQVDDLPQRHVPHLKLEFCHFIFFNEAKLQVLEDDYSTNCAASSP